MICLRSITIFAEFRNVRAQFATMRFNSSGTHSWTQHLKVVEDGPWSTAVEYYGRENEVETTTNCCKDDVFIVKRLEWLVRAR